MCHVCIDDERGSDISSIISVSTTSLGRDGAATEHCGRAVAPTRADSSSAERRVVTPEKPVGTAMGRRPQSIGEEFGGVTIRDDPELGTYF